jgi:hypothetical protein
MSSPTQRTLAKQRREGWPLVEITERFNPWSKTRHDLFSFVDVLCVRQDSILAVQTTSGANVSARLNKIALLPSVVHWLSNPACRLVIQGWSKKGAKGKRKLWECREVEVILSETGNPIVKT